MLYTPAMLAELLGLPVALLRSWQRRGWIRPTRIDHRLPQFDFTEVNAARNLAALHTAGISAKQIARKLAELRQRLPAVQRPLVELGLVLDGRQILVRQGTDLLEPSGQFRMDFAALEAEQDDDQSAVSVISPAAFLARGDDATPHHATPRNLADWAAELEEAGQLAEAADMYRAALAALTLETRPEGSRPGGSRAELCFQLAETLYRLGDAAAARERYYMAIELDDDFVEARCNLGCLLAETGEKDLALAAFQGAIAHHAAYADAHYHLARTLDELARGEEALPHWRRFLELTPESPWAGEAVDRLRSTT